MSDLSWEIGKLLGGNKSGVRRNRKKPKSALKLLKGGSSWGIALAARRQTRMNPAGEALVYIYPQSFKVCIV